MKHNSDKNIKDFNDDPTQIEDNCWIASNVIILSGVMLGPHTIAAVGAVVTKSFPEENQVICGNPAMIIKKLLPYMK